jgi:hypothetical protein
LPLQKNTIALALQVRLQEDRGFQSLVNERDLIHRWLVQPPTSTAITPSDGRTAIPLSDDSKSDHTIERQYGRSHHRTTVRAITPSNDSTGDHTIGRQNVLSHHRPAERAITPTVDKTGERAKQIESEW